MPLKVDFFVRLVQSAYSSTSYHFLLCSFCSLSPQERHPAEFAKRTADKLNYRYPGVTGESYIDVIERVRPVIIELERQRRSIVIVCHLAVLR